MQSSSWAWTAAVCALTGATFLVLAIPGLGSSFTYDESVTVGYFVRAPTFIDAITTQIVFNNHPAFTALAWLVDALGGTTEAWMRAPAVLAGLACVIVVARYATARFGLVPGLAAGAFVATNPLFVELSRQARGYSLAALAVAASSVLGARTGGDSDQPLPGTYAVAVAAGLLAHLYVAIAIAAHGAYVLGLRDRVALERWFQLSVLGGAGAVVGYLPMLGTMAGAAGARDGAFVPNFPEQVAEALFGAPALAALAVATIFFATALRPRTVPAIAVASALVGAVWIVLQPFDLYPRFLVWVVPAVGLLLSAAAERRLQVSALALVLVLASVPVVVDRRNDTSTIRAVAASASALAEADRAVCFLGYFGESFAAYIEPEPPGPDCDVTLVRRDDPQRGSLAPARPHHVTADPSVCAFVVPRNQDPLPGLEPGCGPLR